jgi:hypothetical protein
MRIISLVILTSLALHSFGQVTYKKHQIKSSALLVVDPKAEIKDYQAQIISLEAPSPGGDSYRSFLMRQKIKQSALHPRKPSAAISNKSASASPIVNKGTRMYRYVGGQNRDVFGGIPNDNTLAVSNDGIVLCGINSAIWAYDSNNDTTYFSNYVRSLKNIGGGSISDNNFDPKVMYDPKADRWILVYLQNTTPSTSLIKVCFSTTNNPNDPWNSYTLPGNPLNNNRWSDFPALTITEEEVFLTLNLIIPGVSWQVGFDGSIIWQIDKEDGFSGASVLKNTLWTDIEYKDTLIRNLHPVWGAEGIASEPVFLSNRNFDLSNDSIFILHLDGTLSDTNAVLNINVATSNKTYGVPPNARQFDTDLTDPTRGLQTNDARVLGAISNGDWIQFVGNTVVPATGFCGIYHGFIKNPLDNPQITANIIQHTTQDFGYPNLSWSGDEDCDIETLIGFDFASPSDDPGVAAVYFDNDSLYSDATVLKAGESYTDRHDDSYERWGDYFGMQRKYDDGKKAWLAGYFGNTVRQNITWVSEIESPDKNNLKIASIQTGNHSLCKGELEIVAIGGVPPFQYLFNGIETNTINQTRELCSNDTLIIGVKDSRGCFVSDTIYTKMTLPDPEANVFPNPSSELVVIQFEVDESQNIEAAIFDNSGHLVDVLLNHPTKFGKNEILFNIQNLDNGLYYLRLKGSKGYSKAEKFVKAGK